MKGIGDVVVVVVATGDDTVRRRLRYQVVHGFGGVVVDAQPEEACSFAIVELGLHHVDVRLCDIRTAKLARFFEHLDDLFLSSI
jgi:hypothetical protein